MQGLQEAGQNVSMSAPITKQLNVESLKSRLMSAMAAERKRIVSCPESFIHLSMQMIATVIRWSHAVRESTRHQKPSRQ